MKNVVLDTHVLVWLLDGDSRLGPLALDLVEKAAERSEVSFSAISAWEIAMLVSKGRLKLGRDVLDWLTAATRLPGMRMTPLSASISVDSTRLPEGAHGDPSDRLIIATARQLDGVLVTADRAIIDYAEHGHLDVHVAGL